MKLEDYESTRGKVLAVITEVGPARVRDWAHACLEAEIWDDSQVESFTLRGAIEAVKLIERSDPDGSGLPIAAAVGKGPDAIHKTREMFTFEDYVSRIEMGVASIGADHAMLRAWQTECRSRFGTAPSIPDLV